MASPPAKDLKYSFHYENRCTDSAKVGTHRRQHIKADTLEQSGFQRFRGKDDCEREDCRYRFVVFCSFCRDILVRKMVHSYRAMAVGYPLNMFHPEYPETLKNYSQYMYINKNNRNLWTKIIFRKLLLYSFDLTNFFLFRFRNMSHFHCLKPGCRHTVVGLTGIEQHAEKHRRGIQTTQSQAELVRMFSQEIYRNQLY